MTRIVQFASFYTATSGGLRTCVDALGRRYTERGHDRVLVVPGTEDRHEDTASGRRITLASPSMFGSEEYRRLNARRRIWRLLDRIGPDVIEVHDKLQVTWLSTWAHRAGVPIVLVSHERLDAVVRDRVRGLPARVPLVPVVNRVNRALRKRVDAIVTASTFAAEEFARAGVGGVLRIPLGVDLDTFQPLGICPWGDPPTELVLLSRLSAEKNPELALAALRVLQDSGLRANLTVIGDGPLRDRLQERARGLSVRFLGHVSDRLLVADVVARADVALCPSGVETFGLATLEELACGTPVVVPPRGALRELVYAAPDAGAVRPETAAAFADGVRELLAVDPVVRRAAARSVAERYPWSATVDRFLELHSSLAGSAAAA